MKGRQDFLAINKLSNLFIEVIGKNLNLNKIKNRKLNVGFFVWARHKPKELFYKYIELNKILTDNKFNVIVDDNCSEIFMQIDKKEQEELVMLYLDFFKECNVKISSVECKISIQNFLEFIKKIPHKAFYSFLPQKKKEQLTELNLGELAHIYLEINTIKYALSFCDVLLVGKRSSNIAYFYHRYVNKDSNFIIVDDF